MSGRVYKMTFYARVIPETKNPRYNCLKKETAIQSILIALEKGRGRLKYTESKTTKEIGLQVRRKLQGLLSSTIRSCSISSERNWTWKLLIAFPSVALMRRMTSLTQFQWKKRLKRLFSVLEGIVLLLLMVITGRFIIVFGTSLNMKSFNLSRPS